MHLNEGVNPWNLWAPNKRGEIPVSCVLLTEDMFIKQTTTSQCSTALLFHSHCVAVVAIWTPDWYDSIANHIWRTTVQPYGTMGAGSDIEAQTMKSSIRRFAIIILYHQEVECSKSYAYVPFHIQLFNSIFVNGCHIQNKACPQIHLIGSHSNRTMAHQPHKVDRSYCS